MSLVQAVPPVPPPIPTIPVDPNAIMSHLDSPFTVMVVLLIVVAVTVVTWPIVRAIARRLEGKPSLAPALQSELEQMHQRLAEMDVLQQRLAELEERLDFAERLLARGDSQATLPRGSR